MHLKFQLSYNVLIFFNILTVFCSPLSAIDNGNLTYTTMLTEEGYTFHTLVEFHCDQGNKPSASSPESRQCEGLGDWNGQEQSCIAGNENI